MRNLCLASLFLSAAALPAFAQNVIPTDAKPTCALTQADLDKWAMEPFVAGGFVWPADGFQKFDTKCDFYKWGAQMFLWLTSPQNGGLVFDAPGFYNVEHDGSGVFSLVANQSGKPSVFALRDVKDPDVPQADGDVLISQADEVVYYGIHTNDTYVAFRDGFLAEPSDFDFTMDYGGGTTASKVFPIDQTQAGKVVDYGVAKGIITTDPDIALKASTMELKSSWVDASTVDASNFVTIDAVVPTYSPRTGDTWTFNGLETKTLAMVGLHIAAPVQGHPELVWISYEHLSNAPMDKYVYTQCTDATTCANITHPYSGAGNWVFMTADGALPASIPAVATTNGDDIVAISGQTIESVDVAQMNPWGRSPGASSDDDVLNSNDLVSLNASLIALLAGDLRAQYYQIGGLWTSGGELPSGGTDAKIAGGLTLANSTLETFHQFPQENNAFQTNNCFSCHNAKNDDGVKISHIFDGIKATE